MLLEPRQDKGQIEAALVQPHPHRQAGNRNARRGHVVLAPAATPLGRVYADLLSPDCVRKRTRARFRRGTIET